MIFTEISTYKDLLSIIGYNTLGEFYGIPSILWCYSTAQTNAKLMLFQTGATKVYLRKRGDSATVYYIQGNFTSNELNELRETLTKNNFSSLKFATMLRNLREIVPDANKMPTWILDDTWKLESLDKRTRYKFRKAEQYFTYRLATDEDIPLIITLLDDWIVLAKKRYFILNTGPYRKMISNYGDFPNMKLYVLIHNATDKICGFFDSHSCGNMLFPAQGKHTFEFPYAGRALNLFFIDLFLDGKYNYSNWGETANTMKKECGLKKVNSYSISNIKLEKKVETFGGYFE